MNNDDSARINRRDLLRQAGGAAALGLVAAAFGAALPRDACAADDTLENCLTILYPSGDGIHFDADYYRDRHLPLLAQVCGKSIARVEFRKALPVEGTPSLAITAATNIWLADAAAFAGAMAERAQPLVEDLPKFTNGRPLMQRERVYGQAGRDRDAVRIGDTCLTILYPNGDGVRWDVDYYRDRHLPLLMRLYGPDAIKRFELRHGDSGRDGGPAPYVGSVGLYINDAQAFGDAAAKHAQELIADTPNYSSVSPVFAPTVVHGIG